MTDPTLAPRQSRAQQGSSCAPFLRAFTLRYSLGAGGLNFTERNLVAPVPDYRKLQGYTLHSVERRRNGTTRVVFVRPSVEPSFYKDPGTPRSEKWLYPKSGRIVNAP